MIVDGRAIASDILARVRASMNGRTPVVRAVVVAPSPATESYLRVKAARAKDAGMTLEIARLPDGSSTDEVVRAVEAEGCDALIVQLPLPAHIDSGPVLDAVPLGKDADVLSRAAYARFLEGAEGALLPPVVCAVAEILSRSGIALEGKRAVVVGQGKLVGMPVAAWMERMGAEVAAVTREAGDLSALKDADIVVSGAGSPGLIRPEHLSPGAVLIDAGTSESGGAIVGDADPACAEVAGVFTPVPGGVGPVAVACLFSNVARLLGRFDS